MLALIAATTGLVLQPSALAPMVPARAAASVMELVDDFSISRVVKDVSTARGTRSSLDLARWDGSPTRRRLDDARRSFVF